MSTEPWVAIDDIEHHLGVSHNTVYHWIDDKGLPAHKLDRLRKFKLSEVDGWVRAGGVVDADADLSDREC